MKAPRRGTAAIAIAAIALPGRVKVGLIIYLQGFGRRGSELPRRGGSLSTCRATRRFPAPTSSFPHQPATPWDSAALLGVASPDGGGLLSTGVDSVGSEERSSGKSAPVPWLSTSRLA